MKAEDYIKRSEFSNGFIDNSFNGQLDRAVVASSTAMNAIQMARKEEREKAIEAFREVSTNECCNCKDACSVRCGTDCLLNKLKELLNKESEVNNTKEIKYNMGDMAKAMLVLLTYCRQINAGSVTIHTGESKITFTINDRNKE